MASQLSKKAALPLAKILATCRNNVSNTGPWVLLDPDGPHVCPMSLAIGEDSNLVIIAPVYELSFYHHITCFLDLLTAGPAYKQDLKWVHTTLVYGLSPDSASSLADTVITKMLTIQLSLSDKEFYIFPLMRQHFIHQKKIAQPFGCYWN